MKKILFLFFPLIIYSQNNYIQEAQWWWGSLQEQESSDSNDSIGCENCLELGGFYCGDDESNWTSYSPYGCVPDFYIVDGYNDCVDGSDESGEVTDCESFINGGGGLGIGMGLMPASSNTYNLSAVDGDINDVYEEFVSVISEIPEITGQVILFNIRLKDRNGNWGPTFSRSITITENTSLRNLNISQGEFYWDSQEPSSFVAFDGDFDSAVETIFTDNTTLPTDGIMHKFNIRLMDENGNWGPVFSRVVNLIDLVDNRDLSITQGEFYWDSQEPNSFVAFDGDFDSAVETIFTDNTTLPTDGIMHKFNIRLMDENGNWGPVFSRVVNLIDLVDNRDLSITQGEFYWDDESPTSFVAFDGNFDSAVETIFADNTTFPTDGIMHKFNIRLMDENGNWGPVFSRVVNLIDLVDNRDLSITQGEFYWDDESPTSFIAFDGEFSDAVETVFADNFSVPDQGLHLFNIRIMDENSNWGPVFSRVVYVDGVVNEQEQEDSCLCGDVNDDGVTNITDASIIALWVVGIGELTCLSSADVNGDGVVNITDASNIALWVVGIGNLDCD